MRPCKLTQEWGYSPNVEVIPGEKGQPAKMVCLVLGEIRRTLSFSEEAWSNLTPEEARELAQELLDAAKEAERNI